MLNYCRRDIKAKCADPRLIQLQTNDVSLLSKKLFLRQAHHLNATLKHKELQHEKSLLRYPKMFCNKHQ